MTEIVARHTALEIHSHPLFEVTEVIGFPSHTHPSKHPMRSVDVGDLYSRHTTELLLRVKHDGLSTDRSKVWFVLRGAEAGSGAAFSTGLEVTATFSADPADVERSIAPSVAEKVEEYRTTQALLAANEAWNRGDQAGGDAILDAQKTKAAGERRRPWQHEAAGPLLRRRHLPASECGRRQRRPGLDEQDRQGEGARLRAQREEVSRAPPLITRRATVEGPCRTRRRVC